METITVKALFLFAENNGMLDKDASFVIQLMQASDTKRRVKVTVSDDVFGDIVKECTFEDVMQLFGV